MQSVTQKFLERNRSQKLNVHVFGDAMVDEYYAVKVNRISPETPMPIMWSATEEPIRRPGGAANVAYQLKHFNAYKTCHHFYDPSTSFMFHDHGVFSWPGTCFGQAALPIKRRYLDGGVQVVRHDIEQPLCGFTQEKVDFYAANLIKALKEANFHPDVAILSDYDKGFFATKHSYLHELLQDTITIVDPKKEPLDRWRGCTIFKPNEKEAVALSGKSNWQSQAEYFAQRLNCRAVVITRGGKGVAGIADGELFAFDPDRKVDAESVVGAGDCFCAIFGMAVAYGFDILDAVKIAWDAGAVYVQRRLNEPICPGELSPHGIVHPKDLTARNFKLVFTNGCFDAGLTAAHVTYLRAAKRRGDKLVVALNSDASVTRLKGVGRPIMPLEERMHVVAAVAEVDFVTSFDEDTPLEIIKEIMPDLVIKGGDWMPEQVVGHGIVPVETTPLYDGLSTTRKIERMRRVGGPKAETDQ